MKKILKFSLITILLLSLLGAPQNTSAATNYEDSIVPYDIASELVKKQVKLACGSYSRATDDYETEESTLIPNDELDDSIEPLNANLTSQIRTSDKGSRMVLAVVNGIHNWGYCHLFERHMIKADGTRKNYDYKLGAGQFQYAQYPATTMKIIMEVVNGTTVLTPEAGNKFSKTAYSKIERENVKVILRKGKDVTSRGNFSAYDYVIVTAYPIFPH